MNEVELRARLFGRLLCGLAVLFASAPVSAERIHTYWRLEPVEQALPTRAIFGTPFLEQRLLPVRLVRLIEPITVGSETLPAGTVLYLVFNSDGRVGWCPPKDRSLGNRARTLFIPILDQRPCLTDSDNDGRFDSSFSVYDKYGGPPSVRGSIDAARPLGASARFVEADVHEFPQDMRMRLELRGSRNLRRARRRLSFTRPIDGSWPDMRGVQTAEGTVFVIGNIDVLLRSVAANGEASIEVAAQPDVYISTSNNNTLFWNPLPPFLGER
jgi:hypothetical protein